MRVVLTNRGVRAALLSAVLFGAGTPLAKLLLGDVSPWMLAVGGVRVNGPSSRCPPTTQRV